LGDCPASHLAKKNRSQQKNYWSNINAQDFV
jgi:hypothetical protein